MLSRPFAFLSLLSFFVLSPFSPAQGDVTIIADIVLNHVPKGGFFVNLTDTGDFLIRTDDLKKMGFKDPQGTVYEIEDELYIPLSSMKGVEFQFNERNLTLEITALPFHFSRQVIDLIPLRPPDVRYTSDSSSFLNYGLNYATDFTSSPSFDLTNQFGLRNRHLLFFTDSIYTKSSEDSQFVRLMSSFSYDRRETLQKIVIGDFTTSPGDLGSSVNLGGISYQKAYLIDPYFIKHPQIDLSGTVTLPSEMIVYLNGLPIHQETLSPGEFDLRNITPREGAGLLEIILRDPLGKEVRLQRPFYLTTGLLKKGLHDYSYNIGFLREDFGMESFEYGDLAISAFHLYGISDYLTAGISAEALEKRYNLGPSASFRILNTGAVVLALAGSHDEDLDTGFASLLSYIYQGRKFNVQLIGRTFSKDYLTLTTLPTAERSKYQGSVGIGYNSKKLGSLTLGYSIINNHDGSEQQVMTAGYSRLLWQRVTFLASFRRIDDSDNKNEFLIGLNYHPGHDTSVFTRYQKSDDTSTETIQIQNNPPLGEGWGGRAFYERKDSDTSSTNTLDTMLQYNTRYGIYTGRYRTVEDNQIFQASAAGGVAYVGRTVGLSRPITDSFGLVEVDQLKDVRVYVNNQEVGKTGTSGKIFIPNLSSYYDNQVSINDRDIPIDYSIDEVTQFISPPLRSGSYIKFKVTKFQAFFGKIQITIEDQVKPVEFHEIMMMVDNKETAFPTGSDGEFYLENISSGSYKASFTYMDKPCTFDIIIPETEEMMTDLGELVCD